MEKHPGSSMTDNVRKERNVGKLVEDSRRERRAVVLYDVYMI